MRIRNLFIGCLAVGLLFLTTAQALQAAPLFTVKAFDLTGGGSDDQLNSTFETMGIWDAIDGGATAGTISVGSTTYNVPTITTNTATSIEYNHGTFGVNNPFSSVGMGGDNFSVRALGTVTFQPGTYSIGAGSDDCLYVRLAGVEFDTVGGQGGTFQYRPDTVFFDAPTGYNNSIGTFTVTSPTTTTLDTFFYELGGGENFDLTIKSGADLTMGGPGDGWELLQNGALGGNVTVDSAYTLPARLPPPPPDMVSHYAFDGNTNDGGSLGNTSGALVGDATYAPGFLGQGLTLDGSGDYFDTNQDAPYDFQNGNISISTWVKLDGDDWNDTWEAIFAKGEGNTYRLARSSNSDDQLSYGNNFNQQTVDLRDNEWHHVVITHDSGGQSEFFLDGVSLGTGGGSISDNRGSDLFLGANSEAGGREFGGMIDDFAIYGDNIGPDWAKAVYALATDPEYGYNAGQVHQLGLLHYFGEGTTMIGDDLWEYADIDPLDGNTFIQFGANGSGVHLAMVPEPATIALWSLLGLGCIGYIRRRRKS